MFTSALAKEHAQKARSLRAAVQLWAGRLGFSPHKQKIQKNLKKLDRIAGIL